jgi:hypothetical protein
MPIRIHGVLSLGLVLASFLVGLLGTWRQSSTAGLAYLAVLLLSPPLILYAFCAKCACGPEACGHVLPARLRTWLPARKEEDYTPADLLGTGLGLAALVLFPQFWLWRAKILWAVFWLFLAFALAEIRFRVCRPCRNGRCPVCPAPGRD